MKNALVIGASRGLGLGLATELAHRGWNVVGTARKPADAKGLAALVSSTNGRVATEAIDIARAEDADALAQRLANRRFELLFVNAGIAGAQANLETARREDLTEILWTNGLAPVRVAQRLLGLVREGGTVAFMSSVLGSIGENTSGGFDLYRASKAALNMFARSFSVTAAKEKRIAVLSLHPGWVRTDMGGPQAPLSVEESVRGLANVLENEHAPTHRFLDYTGREIAW